MSDADLWIVFGISATALLFLTLFQRPIIVTLFEPEVAASLGIPVRMISYVMFTLVILVLVSSLQAVGCILALALLAAPAATVYMFSDSPRTLFWGGAVLGSVSSAIALIVSYWLDLPAGSTIVVILGIIFSLAYFLSPKYGVARCFFREKHGEG